MQKKKSVVYRRFLCLLLSLILLVLSIPVTTVFAEETRQGTVNGDGVRVRTDAGTDFNSICKLYRGHEVVVHGEAVASKGTDSYNWYRITFTYNNEAKEGYIAANYVTLKASSDIPVVENPNFETQLAAFPEDYKAGIRALHELHPSWNFEAFNTGLNWSYVQELENRLGYSFTNSKYKSHYSTAPGSYDWETDTFVVMEGKTWYQASPAMVAYFMDPRNFLTESDIFQFEKLAFSEESQPLAAVEAMMKGTFMEGKSTVDNEGKPITYAQTFLSVAKTYNVSAFHLVTRCIQEVGWDGNECSSGTYPGYEGYYNFFNIGASGGAKDGMKRAQRDGWDTPYKAIAAGANIIGEKFIAIGQDTPYLQKYDLVGTVANHQYMTNVSAPYSEGRIQKNKYEDMGFLETAFTFRIPIYQNMPKEICTKPAESGSPNNYLKSLSVDGYSLTPTFDFYECLNQGVNSYTIIINGDVNSIQVNAAAVSSTATVSGSVGRVSLQSGENRLTIVCTAANGSTRTFVLKVILNGSGSSGEVPTPPGTDNPPPETDNTPSGWNPSVTIQGSIVSGLTPGTDIKKFLSSLGLFGNAAATLTDEKGNSVSGAVRTGLVLNYFDGTNTTRFQLVVYGDVNQDSAIDAIDLLMIRRNLLGITKLSGVVNTAADTNHDGKVDAIDLLLVRRTLLGLSTITQ